MATNKSPHVVGYTGLWTFTVKMERVPISTTSTSQLETDSYAT
jgi:hypothetical protein